MKPRILAGGLALALATLTACGREAPPPSSSAPPAASGAPGTSSSGSASETASAPVDLPASALAHGGYAGPLPPLPPLAYAARPPDTVRAVYDFAARRPDVLDYVPCFCGCERNGHGDNTDCFVRSRGPQGRPQWETHGMG